jgi:hypothetical protein
MYRIGKCVRCGEERIINTSNNFYNYRCKDCLIKDSDKLEEIIDYLIHKEEIYRFEQENSKLKGENFKLNEALIHFKAETKKLEEKVIELNKEITKGPINYIEQMYTHDK